MSMAHGLETRVPFLDNDLVDLAMRIPVGMKLGNLDRTPRVNENEPGSKTKDFFDKTADGKLILRQVLRGHVPDDVSTRRKQGFSGPDASWFKGDSIDYVRRRLYDPGARLYDYLDRAAVRTLLDEHLEGHVNRRLLIWSLLSFEQWLETFLGAAASKPNEAMP
jgi:asparagine synthase (glutamine-hydrolysing)